jgi:hypothetical protein
MKTTTVLLLIGLAAQANAALETYTTTSGVSIDAETATLSQGNVIFRRPDGLHFTVPLSKLSADDQARAKTQAGSPTVAAQAAPAAPAMAAAAPAPAVNTTPQPNLGTTATTTMQAEGFKQGTRWRMDVKVSSGKKDRLNKLGEIDDRDLVLTPGFDLTNGESKVLQGARAYLVTLGEHACQRDEFAILSKEDAALNLQPLTKLEHEGKSLTLKYDDKGYAKHGYKYHGYLFYVKNSAGEVIFSKASTPYLLNSAPKIATLAAGTFMKRNFAPSVEDINYYSR